MSLAEANELIKRDQSEPTKLGQRVSETFHLSDVFLRLDRLQDLERFLDLLFGNLFETPTIDEYGMFLAHSAALRSADLSRQVGAALISPGREVLAVGANEVPKFGGGQYWAGDVGDHRDFILGYDPNEKERNAITQDILADVKKLLKPTPREFENIRHLIENKIAGIKLPITEYGRVVHAEMEAIISCARKCLSTINSSLYSTTFPCHVCAKHIVAAGISEVVFIEPYPKSKALSLHPDSITLDEGPGIADPNKVRFRPFLGISPRRYVDLFSLNPSSGYRFERKDDKGNKLPTIHGGAPRIPPASCSYRDLEAEHLGNLRGIIE